MISPIQMKILREMFYAELDEYIARTNEACEEGDLETSRHTLYTTAFPLENYGADKVSAIKVACSHHMDIITDLWSYQRQAFMRLDVITDDLLIEMLNGRRIFIYSVENKKIYNTDVIMRFNFKKKCGELNIGHPDFEYIFGGDLREFDYDDEELF